MKNNFKHIIALFLVMVMSFQMAAFVAADETAETTEEVVEEVYVPQHTKEFEILNALGIYTVLDATNFAGDKELTRAEAAAVVAHMVGLIDSLSMEGKAMPYTDMEGKDPYAYEVYHMNRLGIMNGYGDTFKPYDSITEEQFVKVIVEALGYGAEAQSMGGYPHGYTITAGKYHILDGVSFKGAVPLTQDVAVKIAYNAISVETPNVIAFDNGGFVTTVGNTVLNQYLDVTKDFGVLKRNSNTFMGIGGASKKGVVQIGDTFYYTGKSNCDQYLGYNVEFFYKKTAEDEIGTILWAAPRNNTVVTIDAKDIVGYTNRKYNYYTGNTEKNIKVPMGADVIYNGVAVKPGFRNFVPEIGYVDLVDNDEDGEVDVLLINSYGIYYIEANNAYDGILTSKDGKKVTYLDADWYVIGEDGNSLAGETVAKDTVMLLAVNEDGDLIRGFVVTDTIAGTIDTLYKQGGINIVGINGEEYKASSYCNADFGTKLKLDTEVGFVVYDGMLLVQVSPKVALTESVGYLIEVGQTSGLEGKIMVRMLMQTGEVKIVDVNEKAKLVCYGKPDVKAEDFKANLSYSLDLYENNGNTGRVYDFETTERQPVIYKLNAAGELIYLEVAPNHNQKTASNISDEEGLHMVVNPLVNQWFTYHAGSLQIHGTNSIMASNGFVINIPESNDADNYESYQILTAEEYKKSLTNSYVDFDTRTKPVRVYRTDNDIIGANIMVGYNLAGSAAKKTKFMIDKIGQAVTDDGVDCYTLKTSSGTIYKTNDNAVFTSVANLSEGDYVQCEINTFGNITKISIIYDWENATIGAGLAGNGGTETAYSGGIAFMKRGDVLAIYSGTIPDGTTAANVDVSKLTFADLSRFKISFYDSSRTRSESHVVEGSVGDIIPYLTSASEATSIFMTYSWGNPGSIILYK